MQGCHKPAICIKKIFLIKKKTQYLHSAIKSSASYLSTSIDTPKSADRLVIHPDSSVDCRYLEGRHYLIPEFGNSQRN